MTPKAMVKLLPCYSRLRTVPTERFLYKGHFDQGKLISAIKTASLASVADFLI